MTIENHGDFWALTHNIVEDVDLVINRDTTVLAQALDTVGDLAAKALALELWSKLRV